MDLESKAMGDEMTDSFRGPIDFSRMTADQKEKLRTKFEATWSGRHVGEIIASPLPFKVERLTRWQQIKRKILRWLSK